jgi:hypothetical protein
LKKISAIQCEAAKSEIKTMQDSFMRNGMGEAEAAGKAVEIYRKRMKEALNRHRQTLQMLKLNKRQTRSSVP